MISTKHRAKTLRGVISACKRKMNMALKRQNIAEAFAFARLIELFTEYEERGLKDHHHVEEISCGAYIEADEFVGGNELLWRLETEMLFQMFQNRGENLLDYNQWMHDTVEIELRAAFIAKYMAANKVWSE